VKQRALRNIVISKCSVQLTRYHSYYTIPDREFKVDAHILHTTTLVTDLALSQDEEMKQDVQLTIPTTEPPTTIVSGYPEDVWFLTLSTTVSSVNFEQAIRIMVK
jgi:hypothetical protein